MKLDRVEKWARWAVGAGFFIMAAVALTGTRRGARRAKGRTVGQVPVPLQGYQTGSLAFYAPASAIGLGLFYLLWRPIRLTLSAPARAAALILGTLLYVSGLALFLWGRLALGEMYNVSSTYGTQLYAGHRLITSGPYTLMRHPMYVGGALAELGALLIYRNWAALLMALNVPALVVRARHEEEALAAEFGDAWAEYCRRVPAWIPRLRR
jgi:protein-S-isoprenylcysteine O-methyltransferase Ste14